MKMIGKKKATMTVAGNERQCKCNTLTTGINKKKSQTTHLKKI